MPHRAIAVSLALSVLLSGCWLSHRRGGDAGTDSGRLPPGAAVEAGVAIDASLPRPPARCDAVRPDTSCFESFLIAPGRPFALPYAFDQCGCCPQTECDVAVDAGTQTLSLTTTLCADPCDCDACVTPTGTCDVPALETGMWNVVMNGVPAFQLPVREDGGLVPPPPACASYAEEDRCAPAFPFGGATVPSTVCVSTQPISSTLDVLHVEDACSRCQLLAGPCYATLEPRLTDDLPPGGDIHLSSWEYGTACDVDCPGACVPRERDCFVPTLVDGDTYRVYLGDELVTSFVAGVTEPGCFHI